MSRAVTKTNSWSDREDVVPPLMFKFITAHNGLPWNNIRKKIEGVAVGLWNLAMGTLRPRERKFKKWTGSVNWHAHHSSKWNLKKIKGVVSLNKIFKNL